MSFTSQKYKKYFTLNHNGPKNVRTVQTITSIGVEMMPAGADVGYGWEYIKGGAAVHERVLLPCRLLGRRCHKKSCPFSGIHPMRRCVGVDVAERGLGTMADLLGMLFFSCFSVCVDNHAVSVCLTAVCEC